MHEIIYNKKYQPNRPPLGTFIVNEEQERIIRDLFKNQYKRAKRKFNNTDVNYSIFIKLSKPLGVLGRKIQNYINKTTIYFIGITERFNTDINKLGEMLGWPNIIPEITENTGTKYYNNPDVPTQLKDITAKMRRQIRDLNIDDFNLYETRLGIN